MKQDPLQFEIQGKPHRKNLFKSYRSYIAAYDDSLYIDLDGEHDAIPIDKVFNVYIQEPIADGISCRTTMVEFYDEGEDNWYALEDNTFPGLAAKMETLLQTGLWARFPKMKELPDNVRWMNACCALTAISSGQDAALFGGAVKTPESAQAHRKTLYDDWGFETRANLLDMLPKLLAGRAVQQYTERINRDGTADKLLAEIHRECGERSIWAWDLCRLMLLSSLDWLCDWLSYQEAIEWCTKAGLELQARYRGWDEMVKSYLLGYCFWSGEELTDPRSEACNRLNIYKQLRKASAGPYSIDWQTPLQTPQPT